MQPTLIEPADGGLKSTVAKAGAPVSPALISPPRPLDRLRMRGLPLLFGPERGVSLSFVFADLVGVVGAIDVASRGKASVLDLDTMVTCRY